MGLLGDQHGLPDPSALVGALLVRKNEPQADLPVYRLDPIRGHGFYEAGVIDRARKDTYALFDILDKVLTGCKYLVGDRLSIGDIMVACVVGRACKFIFDRAFRAAHPNTMKHYELVASDPTYLELAGDITYVEEEPVPQAAVALKGGRPHKWLRTEA